jgi:hypothetical protein
MIEMEVTEMKIYKPVAVIRGSQLLPPHIPRHMPAIYRVLEGIEEGVKLLEDVLCQMGRGGRCGSQGRKNRLY